MTLNEILKNHEMCYIWTHITLNYGTWLNSLSSVVVIQYILLLHIYTAILHTECSTGARRGNDIYSINISIYISIYISVYIYICISAACWIYIRHIIYTGETNLHCISLIVCFITLETLNMVNWTDSLT
jgi:hypothetical protein